MRLQVIQDGYGKATGVFVPMNDWNMIVQKHEDLKALVNTDTLPKNNLSERAGKLSHETAEEMSHQMEVAVNELYGDYVNDKDLTAFTSLDFDNFYETK